MTTNKQNIYGGRDPWDLPAYTIPMAAGFVRLPYATLRSWVVGRTYETDSEGSKFAKPLIHPPSSDLPARRYLSFTNLVEAHVLASMRRVHEIEMHKCRKAITFVEREFDVKHPLARELFRTNGVDLFVEKLGKLINVSAEGQTEMREAIADGLKRVEYVSGTASQLFPLTRESEGFDQPKLIEINPRLAFGRPVLAGTAIPADEIVQRFRAGDSAKDIAGDFGISEDLITEAIRSKFLEAA